MDAPGIVHIESSHSIWLFDTNRKRYLRAPRGTDLTTPPLESDWAPYHDLEFDVASGAFTVALNADHTRLLRSWRDDRADGADVTGEVVAVASDAKP